MEARYGVAAALAAGIAVLAPIGGRAPAQEAPAGAGAATRLDQRRNVLDRADRQAQALEKDVAAIAEERRRINERLVETAALIQSSEGRMSTIEARLGDLEAQEKLLRGSLAQRHGQIATLLSALLRMGRNPPPVMITRREDALQMVRSAMLIAAAFPELRTQALALAERLGELVRVMTDIRHEGERLRAETERLNDARTRLSGLMEAKRETLAERQAELDKVRSAAAEISKNVVDLNELIAKLDQAVTKNTGLGSYEDEARRAQPSETPLAGGAARPGPAREPESPAPSVNAPSPGDTPAPQVAALTPPPKTTVIELAPLGSAAVPGNPGRIKPAVPFHLARARLPLPAQGRRVLAFGERTQYGGQSKGLVLETRHTAQITSPCDGWIVYAGEFRSYGQLLIINAGGGYHVLLAGLSQINVQPGQFVLAAEPVGTMSGAPKPTPTQKATRTDAPVLYVEFRKDGRPIDPDPWWAADHTRAQGNGHQKVQG
jgi:septal ring factor EnvC (AmiA/AmiB activator)